MLLSLSGLALFLCLDHFSIPASFSPSSSEMSVTPVARPSLLRISRTRVRISTPPVVDQHDFILVGHEPRSDNLAVSLARSDAMTPCVPRPEWRKSASTVRLP